MKKQTAIWFSRHQPTAEQVSDAEWFGYEITGISEGILAGSKNMADNPDVWAAIEFCRGKTVFGVFPSPLRAAWFAAPSQSPASAFEAWNVSRSVEGGKTTFEHKNWVRVQ